MKYHKKRIAFYLLAIFSILSVVTAYSPVNAAVYTGNGNSPAGTAASCNFNHAFTRACGNPVGSAGGGASWHIYTTSSSIQPQYNSGVLSGGIDANTIKSSFCGGRPWYMVYGWDGPNNSVVYGPLAYGIKKLGSKTIEYNSFGAKSFGELQTILSNGTFQGQKVTEEAAGELYQRSNEGWPIETMEKQKGYFCVPADALNVYYSQSNAAGNNGYALGNLDPTNGGVVINAPSVTIDVGGSTPIAFSHNIYSKEQSVNQDVNWQVHRLLYVNDVYAGEEGFNLEKKYDYKIEGAHNGDYLGVVKSIDKPYNGGLAKYIASLEDRPYTDGAGHFVARDEYEKVTFNKVGKYKFCERFDVRSYNTPSTTACVTINVVAPTEYYSKSNASNQNSNDDGTKVWDTTGIQNKPEKVQIKDVTLNAGEKATMVFSHNLYSSVEKDGVNYKITRRVNGGTGITNENEYSIATPVSSRYSANSTNPEVNGTVNFKGRQGDPDKYIGEPRNYLDPDGESSSYLLRDYYEITFKDASNGNTYDFCETVYIEIDMGDGNKDYVEFTSACAKVIVGQPDGTPTPSSTCPSAWTPSSYNNSTATSGTTSVIAAVKKASTDWVKNTETMVYAKPGDMTYWLHCYYPGAQKVYNQTATKDNRHPEPSRLSSRSNTLNNIKMSQYSGWSNWFRVNNKEMTNTNKKNALPNYPIGNSAIRSWSDTYKIETGKDSRAGKTLIEINTASPPKSASVNSPNSGESHSWSCNSYKCHCTTDDETGKTSCDTCYETCRHSNKYHWNSVDLSNAEKEATVKVPYNFNIDSVTVKIKDSQQKDTDGNNVVFAGEDVTVQNATISVGTRYNGTTKGTYATKVEDAKLHLIAYTTNNPKSNGANSSASSGTCSALKNTRDCAVIADETHNLNDPENTSGSTDTLFPNKSYNVFDAPAGLYYCIVAASYPSNSGSDTMMSTSGNGKWYISDPDCFMVAKRPSMEIWGSGLYTTGIINLKPSIKRVVGEDYDFASGYKNSQANNKANTTVFGSWVEQHIIANDKIGGLASGASTGGYNSNNSKYNPDRTPKPGLGGSKEGTNVDFCIRSPLTIPNANCSSSNNPGGLNSDIKPTDKSSLISRFKPEEGESTDYKYVEVTTDNRSINDILNEQAVTSNIGKKTTVIIDATEKKVQINSNITYDKENYQGLSEIPKLIIFAENITIGCKVTNIDAVLIAVGSKDDNGTINTCTNTKQNSNYKDASTQLKIFGTVITDKLILNRTYGNGTGKNSTVPAEIIDYDTSLYLWGAPRTNTSNSGKAEITYQTELAPRY